VDARCAKLQSLQQGAQELSETAGNDKADQLLEKLATVAEQMDALANNATNRQVSFLPQYYCFFRAAAD